MMADRIAQHPAEDGYIHVSSRGSDRWIFEMFVYALERERGGQCVSAGPDLDVGILRQGEIWDRGDCSWNMSTTSIISRFSDDYTTVSPRSAFSSPYDLTCLGGILMFRVCVVLLDSIRSSGN